MTEQRLQMREATQVHKRKQALATRESYFRWRQSRAILGCRIKTWLASPKTGPGAMHITLEAERAELLDVQKTHWETRK
jgi:hypothetical protein